MNTTQPSPGRLLLPLDDSKARTLILSYALLGFCCALVAFLTMHVALSLYQAREATLLQVVSQWSIGGLTLAIPLANQPWYVVSALVLNGSILSLGVLASVFVLSRVFQYSAPAWLLHQLFWLQVASAVYAFGVPIFQLAINDDLRYAMISSVGGATFIASFLGVCVVLYFTGMGISKSFFSISPCKDVYKDVIWRTYLRLALLLPGLLAVLIMPVLLLETAWQVTLARLVATLLILAVAYRHTNDINYTKSLPRALRQPALSKLVLSLTALVILAVLVMHFQ